SQVSYIHTLRFQIEFLDQMNDLKGFPSIEVPSGIFVFPDEKWMYSELLGSYCGRFIWKVMVFQDFGKIGAQRTDHNWHRITLGVGGKIIHDLERLQCISLGQCSIEFKYIEVLTDTDILLHIHRSDFLLGGDIQLEFLYFIGNLGKVGP